MRRLRLSRRFIMTDSGGSRHVDFSYHEQQIVKKSCPQKRDIPLMSMNGQFI